MEAASSRPGPDGVASQSHVLDATCEEHPYRLRHHQNLGRLDFRLPQDLRGTQFETVAAAVDSF